MKKLTAVLLAFTLLITALPLQAAARSGKLDDVIAAETQATAVEIEEEGVVLLKNEDNALPLGDKRVNVFGAGSVQPFYGGAGSGAVTTDDPVTFYEALDAAGIAYNTELKALYERHVRSFTPKTDNTVINNLLQLALARSALDEMPVKYLTGSIMARAEAYSETALLVISRTSAEGRDLKPETLQLSAEEEKLVKAVTAAFDEVIVLFNTGNLMEMGWLEEYDSIKAAMLLWIPGEYGFEGAAKVLAGAVSPSGRLADTAAYHAADHPSTAYFGTHQYDTGDYYTEYSEGIYVGYRYFETFAPEQVQFPFGYGLSYTSFEKTEAAFSVEDEKITAQVTVTNTGFRAGKKWCSFISARRTRPAALKKARSSWAALPKQSRCRPARANK